MILLTLIIYFINDYKFKYNLIDRLVNLQLSCHKSHLIVVIHGCYFAQE